MGLIKVVMGLPVHIKAIIITCLILLGTWMIITPLYLEVLSWSDAVPVWGWIAVGALIIVIASKFGKAIL